MLRFSHPIPNIFLQGVSNPAVVYVELFNKVILETAYSNSTIVIGSFYKELKWEVQCNLVGCMSNDLTDLKALAIQLDKECMGINQCDTWPNAPFINTLDLTNATRQLHPVNSCTESQTSCVGWLENQWQPIPWLVWPCVRFGVAHSVWPGLGQSPLSWIRARESVTIIDNWWKEVPD